MHVGDHGPNVARAVRRLAARRVLYAVEVVDDGLVEIHRVALVEGVDFPARWDLDLIVCSII